MTRIPIPRALPWPSARLLRYGFVSALATVAGATLLALFLDLGIQPFWANAFAVTLPVVPAYVLHRLFTWGDRTGVDDRRGLRTFWLFAVAGAVGSTFAVATVGLLTAWPPALVATQLGTYGILWIVRYLVLDAVVFADPTPPTSALPALAAVPEPAAGVADPTAPTVAAFLPAYNEEDNLEATVRDMKATLAASAREWTVIVVDDGSADATGEVARALAAEGPGVWDVHHPENRGYGAALRTGFEAALATGHDWVFFTDSDGQFEPSQLTGFLRTAERHAADIVVGYRDQRADPWHRRLNGRLWTWLSCTVMRIRFRDVDCAFKLFRRDVVAGLSFTGEAASISPELLARTSGRATRVMELSVWHFPRTHGTQTGAKLSVILRSLVDLWRVSAALRSGS